MEVFIRDVPEQVTELGLRNLLRPYMNKQGIKTYHCRKQQQRKFAFLIFLHIHEGSKFLLAYGQEKPSRTGPVIPAKIQILSTPIFCVISNKSPNIHMLNSLAMEEKEEKAKPKPAQAAPRLDVKKEFRTSRVLCGVWEYAGSSLVFVPYFVLEGNGLAKFGSRSLMLKADSGKRIEFPFSHTYDITTENEPHPSITITLYNAPQFFDSASSNSMDLLVSNTAGLSIDGRKSPQRQRIPALAPNHGLIAGSCYVYRVLLAHDSLRAPHQVAEYMHSLQKLSGLPPITHQQIDSVSPRKSFATCQKELESMLADVDKFSHHWRLKFQIRRLASNGILTPGQILSIVPDIVKILQGSGVDICIAAIRRLPTQIPWAGIETDAKDLDIPSLIRLLKSSEEYALNNDESLNSDGSFGHASDNMAMIHRVMITPAGMYLDGPDSEPMNRVLRKYLNYHEFFLRVSFADEDGEPVRYNPRVSNDQIFNGIFKSVLRNGISIAGRKYDFLGFSHSSLRAQSCWFMAPFTHNGSLIFYKKLIEELGDFTQIRCPAKCAARIGQAFSETPVAVTFPSGTIEEIVDIERNDRVFSDGVGTMSASVMRKIWKAVPSMRDLKPTCFQIRYQGAKGMLSLDTRLIGDLVCLRPSMIKFEGSTSMDIELCGSSLRPLPMYLNRQVIKIMEDMGVQDRWFLHLQSQEVERLRTITATAANAAKFLKSQLIGEAGHLSWFIKKISSLGLEFRCDRFLRDVLELSVMMQVRVMKYRARIPVPSGMTLYGIMDETDFLQEGQIFCTFMDGKVKKNLVGKNLVITRSPALHPGDIQLVEGVTPPPGSPLLYLSNCICFSQKGARDLPSKLSGGDLDGDLYNIIWDPACKPTHTCLPADYPRQAPQDIGRKVTPNDMTDFFVKFMETDQLGRIATSHQVLADQRPQGTSDPDCKMLAELHSTAVDFSKTGIPVNMKLMPRFIPVRPDFMAPGPNIKIEKKEGLLVEQSSIQRVDEQDEEEDFTPYRYYESTKILGKLFRAIDEHEIFSDLHSHRMTSDSGKLLLDELWTYVQQKCRLIHWNRHLNDAREIKDMYEECLLNVTKNYSEHPLRPITELEAFIGNILGARGSQSKRQRDLSIPMKEAFDRDVAFIVGCIRGNKGEDAKDSANEDEYKALERSIACFDVSLGEARRVAQGGRKNEPLVSFRYIAAAICLKEMEKVFG
ncbi:rna-dependent rna polymeras-like protein [Stipitochalara longipes BDJ]|nr:rna-dependent rna polymeras-like protein [Stipitochalara longipes BDJ]